MYKEACWQFHDIKKKWGISHQSCYANNLDYVVIPSHVFTEVYSQ